MAKDESEEAAPSYARRVLVVEDEPLLRDLIGKSLEAAGFIVTTAANAADAKRSIKVSDLDASKQMINLVVENDGKPFRESSRGKGQELYQSVSHRYWFEKVKNKTRLVVQIPLSPQGASQPLA
jgi:hypothetical protein